MRGVTMLVVALALGACGDDDEGKKDTTETTTTDVTASETTTDATATETTTDATTPDDGDVATTTDATTTDATGPGDTDVVEPPQSFPSFVIDLIQEGTSDDTEPVPYTSFSSLPDDTTEGIFDVLFD